jgi:hypothetical protein
MSTRARRRIPGQKHHRNKLARDETVTGDERILRTSTVREEQAAREKEII